MQRNYILILSLIFSLVSCLASPEEYHYNLGQDRMKNNDFEGAILEFNKSLNNLNTSHSTGSYLYFNRGLANENLNRHETAIEDYKKAIELDSNYAEAYFQLAVIETKFNNKSMGCDYLNKSKKIYDADAYVAYHMKEKGITPQKFDSLLIEYCK